MKKLIYYLKVVAIGCWFLSVESACKEDISEPDTPIFSSTETPYNKSYVTWEEDFWSKTLTLDCNQINSFSILSLSNDVIALEAPISDTTFSVTIPSDKSVFLPIASVFWDYPCPDSTFEPAPGQDLTFFLQQGAKKAIDKIQNISASYDGINIGELHLYRFLTPLYLFTGNTELTNCYDPCITGTSQVIVSDGYFLMFRKMKIGTHIIQLHFEDPVNQVNNTWNYSITVQ